MLYSTLLIAASAIAGASAQLISNGTSYNTPIPCCSLPANQLSSDRRSEICEAQFNTCNELCGGVGRVASNGNICDKQTLEYTCNCSNGTTLATAQLGRYQQTVPGLVCRDWYNTCINRTGNAVDQQFQCRLAFQQQCGNDTSGANPTTSSAMPTRTGSASGGSGSGSPSGTAPADAGQTTGAAAAFATYGTPILAGGLLAAFGIAL